MTFEGFWSQSDKESGRGFFKKWKSRAVRSRLPHFVKLARSLESSLEELLNYFDHHISNAMSEGFNSVIQQLKGRRERLPKFCQLPGTHPIFLWQA
jgi:transposase